VGGNATGEGNAAARFRQSPSPHQLRHHARLRG
jgi:hypothetical protein